MSFQVFFHNCSLELQTEVNTAINAFGEKDYELSVKSSGSTGAPKEITHTKERIITSAERTNAFFGLGADSSVLCPLAIHTIGAKMALFRAIAGDYQIHFTGASRDFMQSIPEELKFDLVSLAVVQFAHLAEESPEQLQRFNCILLGGSAIPDNLEEKSRELGLNAFIGFGMTETLSHIALRKLGEPVYSCLEGITVKSTENGMMINDSYGTITSTDIIEEIDNEHFKWMGRNDFAINSGGIKVLPERIENAVSSHFKLKVVVVGIPDVTFGEKVILVAETAIDEQLKMKLKAFIEKEFGKYHVPKAFVQTEFVYLNGLKPDRRSLTKKVVALYE